MRVRRKGGGELSPLGLCVAVGVFALGACVPYEFSDCYPGPGDFSQFKVGDLTGGEIRFDDQMFRKRVVFAVNVASFCGYTPQYRSMNALQRKYGPDYAQQNHPDRPHCHVQFLGFPCNQFGYQEPAENHELMNCIKHVRPGFGFEPNFPVSGKLEVNGAGESPLFTFLKARCPAPFGMIANRTDITWTPIRNNDISWNFQKWLVDHNGDPIKRYTSRTDPVQAEQDIVDLIQKCVKDGADANATKPIDIAPLKPGAAPEAAPAVSAVPVAAPAAVAGAPATAAGPAAGPAPVAAAGAAAGPAVGGLPSADEAQKTAELEAAQKEAAAKLAQATAAGGGKDGAAQAGPPQAGAPAVAAGPASPPVAGAPQSKRKRRSLFEMLFM